MSRQDDRLTTREALALGLKIVEPAGGTGSSFAHVPASAIATSERLMEYFRNHESELVGGEERGGTQFFLFPLAD